jgi:hypothetical protein
MIKLLKRIFKPPTYEEELDRLNKTFDETKKTYDEAIATLDGESQWFVKQHIEETRKKWIQRESEG